MIILKLVHWLIKLCPSLFQIIQRWIWWWKQWLQIDIRFAGIRQETQTRKIQSQNRYLNASNWQKYYHLILYSYSKFLFADKRANKLRVYNFSRVAPDREWLKNLLVDDDSTESSTDESVTEEEIRREMKLHLLRKKYRKRFFARNEVCPVAEILCYLMKFYSTCTRLVYRIVNISITVLVCYRLLIYMKIRIRATSKKKQKTKTSCRLKKGNISKLENTRRPLTRAKNLQKTMKTQWVDCVYVILGS